MVRSNWMSFLTPASPICSGSAGLCGGRIRKTGARLPASRYPQKLDRAGFESKLEVGPSRFGLSPRVLRKNRPWLKIYAGIHCVSIMCVYLNKAQTSYISYRRVSPASSLISTAMPVHVEPFRVTGIIPPVYQRTSTMASSSEQSSSTYLYSFLAHNDSVRP